MPVMTDSVVVVLNSVSNNVLAGLLYEFLPAHSKIALFATGSAAGLRVTLNVGGEQLVDDSAISAQNRTPIIPDDLIVADAGRRGERMILRFRNTTGGSLTAFWTLQVNPVG